MNTFGELRSLLQQPYTPELWERLCAWLPEQDPDSLERELVPYAASILARWPLGSRPMPHPWHQRLLAHNDPGRFPTDHPGPAGPYIRAAGSLLLTGRRAARPNDLRRLARSPHLGAIEALTLEDLTLLPEDVESLCDEPSLDDLHALTLRRTSPNPRHLPDLLTRRRWRLRHLTVDGLHLPPDFFAALAAHPSRDTLTLLDLPVTLLDDDAVLALASALPPNLTHLRLTCARASRDALAALLDALGDLPHLAHLDLFGADLYPRDLDPFDGRATIPRGQHPTGAVLVTFDAGPRFGGLKAALFPGDSITIGRAASSDVLVPHPTIAQTHVRLDRVGNTLTMFDMGSPRGFLVNRVRAGASSVLSPDDTAYVGPAYVKADIVADTY
jgi:hypothetical protein